jgi:hypothetical protein
MRQAHRVWEPQVPSNDLPSFWGTLERSLIQDVSMTLFYAGDCRREPPEVFFANFTLYIKSYLTYAGMNSPPQAKNQSGSP